MSPPPVIAPCPHDTLVSKDSTLVCAACGLTLRELWMREWEDRTLRDALAKARP